MSVRLMGRVFELQIPAKEKLILLALADHARDDGSGCYPSIGTLARKTSLSIRGVQTSMRMLEKARFIVPTGKSKFGTMEYTITPDKGSSPKLPLPKQGRYPRKLPPASHAPPTPHDATKTPACLDFEPPHAATENPASPAPNPSVSGGGCRNGSGCRSLAPSQDTRSMPVETIGKEERKFIRELGRTAQSKTIPSTSWLPKDPLRAELRRGIYPDKVENAFFDSRKLPFADQLRECVRNAVTQLVNNRRGKMMHLVASEIERSAFENVNARAETFWRIQNFDARRSQVAKASVNSVVAAAAASFEKQFPPARPSSEPIEEKRQRALW